MAGAEDDPLDAAGFAGVEEDDDPSPEEPEVPDEDPPFDDDAEPDEDALDDEDEPDEDVLLPDDRESLR
ncbi:hypothetical protein AB6N24_08005 [Cellulomonas sp. 179-A 4D5 NHS]|uniref:hypothetical protein n=1 Tax=Cellulomonas sp. 179-A 4D5 NHS TaxID=3142378 RepID=UPI0039A3D737